MRFPRFKFAFLAAMVLASVPAILPAQSLSIDCGSYENYTGSDGTAWVADRYYSGGQQFYTSYGAASTSDPLLFRTARVGLYGDFSYAIPVANGEYGVTLRFAEIQYWVAGQRIFNVSINNQTVLSNFDVLAQTGGPQRAIDRQFPVSVTNGQITIQLTRVVAEPALNGLEITTASTTGGSSVVRINAGGSAASPFLADQGFSGGSTLNHVNAINLSGVLQPAPVAVYQTARIGNFTGTFAGFAAGSSHKVRLHFAETFFSTAGSRVFNVSINGKQVLTKYDVFKSAGAKNKAVVAEFTQAASSTGQYVVTFASVVNNSLLSGISIQ